MSGFVGSSALGSVQNTSYTGDALITPYRAIGLVIPDVMIEEVNRDELEITQHPVERGSPITDHSYLRPVEVSLRVGWSNSGHYAGYVLDVYAALLDLQRQRQPFDVFTGTRLYNNMLFAGLIKTTNGQSGEFSLMVQALLREIIIVSTRSTQVPAPKKPSKTGTTTGASHQQPKAIAHTKSAAVDASCKAFSGVEKLPIGASSTTLIDQATPLLTGLS